MVRTSVTTTIFSKDETSYFVSVGSRALRFYLRDYENQQLCYDAAKRWQHKQEDFYDHQKSAEKLSNTLNLFSNLIKNINPSCSWKILCDDDTAAFVTDDYMVFIDDIGSFAICLDRKKTIISGLQMRDVEKIVNGLNHPFIPVDIHMNNHNITMVDEMVKRLKDSNYGY